MAFPGVNSLASPSLYDIHPLYIYLSIYLVYVVKIRPFRQRCMSAKPAVCPTSVPYHTALLLDSTHVIAIFNSIIPCAIFVLFINNRSQLSIYVHMLPALVAIVLERFVGSSVILCRIMLQLVGK